MGRSQRKARTEYERMMTSLTELDRADRTEHLSRPAKFFGPAPTNGPRNWTPASRRGHRRWLVATAIAGALAVVFVWSGAPAAFPVAVKAKALVLDLTDSHTPLSRTTPSSSDEVATRRLLPVVDSGTYGSHAFLYTLPDGQPVTFVPCRPLRYVVNQQNMPPGGMEIVYEAVAQIQDATGLLFKFEGYSAEIPREEREAVQPKHYGEGWAPILIAWGDSSDFPDFATGAAGFGGPHPFTPGSDEEMRFVTASVVLNAEYYSYIPPHYGVSVLLHELGHAVGLDHVDDLGEMMGQSTFATTLGPGDLQGLALLGQGRCFRDT